MLTTCRPWLVQATRQSWRRIWSEKSARQFLQYAGTTTLAGLVTTGTVLAMRILFVRHGGMQEAGLFDVAWTLTHTYLMIALTSLGAYYLPTLAGTSDPEARTVLISQVLRTVMLFTVPLIAMVIIFKPWVIHLLYTKEFLPSLSIIQWLLLGDYFKATSWVLATTMLAYADLRTFFWSELVANVGMLGGTWLSLFVFNRPSGVGVTYLLLYLFYLLFCYGYVRRHFHYRISSQQIGVWAAGVVVLALVSLLVWDSSVVYGSTVVVTFILLIAFGWLATSHKERLLAFQWARGWLLRSEIAK